MTLKELYADIGGDYEKAMKVLRVEKLMDRHIKKFPVSGVTEALIEAAKSKDPVELFESSHAVKGVCANLGLTKLSDAAAKISDAYRAGSGSGMPDEELAAAISEIKELYEKAADGIRRYSEG
ncbi:MAG: Hpt domain-containing protein [Lachnospiraceae bacterium]|nr:Hpt domain-containing protein [Lachnospiraceae bacterium]